MFFDKYIEEEVEEQRRRVAVVEEEEGFTDVDKKTALDAWNSNLDVFINGVRVKEKTEIFIASEGFSISNFQFDVLQGNKSIIAKPISNVIEKNVNTNEKSQVIPEEPLMFEGSDIERYSFASRDCYTLNPSRDFIEKMFKRINTISFSFTVIGYDSPEEAAKDENLEYTTYAVTGKEEQDTALRVAFTEQGVDTEVPISENEKKELNGLISDYEKKEQQRINGEGEKSTEAVAERKSKCEQERGE